MKKQYIAPRSLMIDYSAGYRYCDVGLNQSVEVDDENEVLVKRQNPWDDESGTAGGRRSLWDEVW